MEPQLEGCGKKITAAQRAAEAEASMEPQLEGCGKPDYGRQRCGAVELQWSRNLRVAESRPRVR